MTTAKEPHCRICAIASGYRALGTADRPWLEDSHYMAFTSIGALVEGWSLIAPKKHALNLLSNYADSTFCAFVEAAFDTVAKVYGRSVVFEHGGQFEGSTTNCGTSHAHLHIVPLSFSLQKSAKAFDASLDWSDCAAKDIRTQAAGREYLFVADEYRGAETSGLLCLLTEGQSQFFRRVIAENLGRSDEANYRTHPNLLTTSAGSDALHRAVSHRTQAA